MPVTVTAPVTPTTLGMSTTPVSFNTGATGSVTITNNGGAPALDVQATIPAGSGITVSGQHLWFIAGSGGQLHHHG